ncbi:hypothetical protein CCYA_CCYA12G3277 [Cyanidiococcus yangmingshanensis]|nr:hypothetical protein CCYA_CCYA12G3277 [Cyanidiococcus yangmingshanensis]
MLDLKQASQFYKSLVTAPKGLKALILDPDTLPVFSTLVTQTEALRDDFVLLEKLENLVQQPSRERQLHIKGIIVGRPTVDTVLALRRELAQPHFGQYHVFFVNLVRRTMLEDLADSDALHESVVNVQEMFFDYLPWSPWVAVGVSETDSRLEATLGTAARTMHQLTVDRQLDTLFSLLVTLKQRPNSIRVLRSFRSCRALAERLAVRLDQESKLWESQVTASASTSLSKANVSHQRRCVLVILDRREDPITPLLTQWTYEAMLQQFFGIRAGRVRLPVEEETRSSEAFASPETEHVVLPEGDPFYAANRYANFGEIGEAVHRLVASFQEHRASALARARDSSNNELDLDGEPGRQRSSSVTANGTHAADMEQVMQILEHFPEFRRQSQLATKHVTLIGALSKQVKMRELMQISQLEQDMTCRDAEQDHMHRLAELWSQASHWRSLPPSVRSARMEDAWRLAALFALRYESTRPETIDRLKHMLRERLQMPSWGLDALDGLLRTCGSKQRTIDLFGNRDLFARAKSTLRRGFGSNVDNQYTQHEPLLAQIMEDAARGRLSQETFEELLPNASSAGNHFPLVIVYVIGGITAEEVRLTAAFQGDNTARTGSRRDFQTIPKGTSFFLSGDWMHTPRSFLERYALVNPALATP